MSMNELKLFEYYWENQNQFSIIYRKNNYGGSVPLSVVKKEYESCKNEIAEELIVQKTLKEDGHLSESEATELAKRIMVKLKQGEVIK